MSNRFKSKKKTWTDNGVKHSIDKNGYNIVYNDYSKEWTRVDELIWEMFGNEARNGREIIHIDGNLRNDAIFNLRLK